jgi:predicted site-specific integrase-resolvase
VSHQPEKDPLVRLNVAARELGVAAKTVKKYCRCQVLRCARLPLGHWRVYRSSLDEALAKQAQTYPK